MAPKTKQDNLMPYILIGRCECDEMVAFPFFWAEDLIPYARERKFDIVDLKRKRFCKEQVKKHIEDKNPTLIFLNGHGDENSVRGYNQEPVITLYENDYLLKGKTAHILSCDNGKFLAQSCIDKGCKGFLGYDGLFHIETDYNPKKQEDLSRQGMKNFLESMQKIIDESHRILKNGGYICILVGDLVRKGEFISLTRKLASLCENIGLVDCGNAIKITKDSVSQRLRGKAIYAELANTKNLKQNHDTVMFWKKI